MTHDQFEVLSNQAVAACAVVYFLAVLAHLAQWASARRIEPAEADGSVRAAEPARAEPVTVGASVS